MDLAQKETTGGNTQFFAYTSFGWWCHLCRCFLFIPLLGMINPSWQPYCWKGHYQLVVYLPLFRATASWNLGMFWTLTATMTMWALQASPREVLDFPQGSNMPSGAHSWMWYGSKRAGSQFNFIKCWHVSPFDTPPVSPEEVAPGKEKRSNQKASSTRHMAPAFFVALESLDRHC